MSTSTRKSSQSQAQSQSVNTTNQPQEGIMNTTTNNTNTGIKCFQIITASGRKIALPETSAYKVLAVCKTAVKEYTRKANETMIGKGDKAREKNPDSIAYDRKMYNRMLIMEAFIKKVLEGVELPDSSDDTLIDQLNSL